MKERPELIICSRCKKVVGCHVFQNDLSLDCSECVLTKIKGTCNKVFNEKKLLKRLIVCIDCLTGEKPWEKR